MFLRNVRSRNYLSWQRGLQYGYCTPCKYLVTRASVGSRDVSLQYCMYWYLALYVASGTLNTTCHERYATSMTLSKSIEIENKCDISLKRHIYSKNEAKMIFPTPPRKELVESSDTWIVILQEKKPIAGASQDSLSTSWDAQLHGDPGVRKVLPCP